MVGPGPFRRLGDGTPLKAISSPLQSVRQPQYVRWTYFGLPWWQLVEGLAPSVGRRVFFDLVGRGIPPIT